MIWSLRLRCRALPALAYSSARGEPRRVAPGPRRCKTPKPGGDAMLHHMPLITTIVAGLGLAFVLGALAQRLRLSPLVGYLFAGVLIGPATPGFVADTHLRRNWPRSASSC